MTWTLPAKDAPVPNGKRQGEWIRLWHLNPPMMPPAILAMGLRAYASRFNIAYWNWELETLPREWILALRYVNAVFVPSTFTANAIMQFAKQPVIVVPHPIDVGSVRNGPNVRQRLGIAADSFLATVIFSFGSSMERKNPIAAIRAFRKSLGNTPNAYLIIKTTDGNKHASDLAQIRGEIQDLPNVIVIDEMWDKSDISGLIQDSSVYVSLHRSEGFGLNIAEAILRNIPVVTTNWSGNIDFCCPSAVHLIESRLVPVASDHPEFSNMRGNWADPDVNMAAASLTTIFANFDAARQRAIAARNYATTYFSNNSYHAALKRLAASVVGDPSGRNPGGSTAIGTTHRGGGF